MSPLVRGLTGMAGLLGLETGLYQQWVGCLKPPGGDWAGRPCFHQVQGARPACQIRATYVRGVVVARQIPNLSVGVRFLADVRSVLPRIRLIRSRTYWFRLSATARLNTLTAVGHLASRLI